jgi:SecD/SecF fusion protein
MVRRLERPDAVADPRQRRVVLLRRRDHLPQPGDRRRYSIAAIITTLHDCLVAVGFIGLATEIYNHMPGLANTLHILPFKVDLNVVAAVLTILGYSLNDTIIVMDRIRENRGKLPGASRKVINDAINQTISRTMITSGTTLIAVLVLYIFGGEGVRVFAYTMLVGILVGTYSSIAIAAPLVWDHTQDPDARKPDRELPPAAQPA